MKNLVLPLLVFGCFAAAAFGQSDATARLRHVFPQVADGRFEDGSGYITSFTITNITGIHAFCSIDLVGLGQDRLFGSSVTIPPGGFALISTRNAAAFDHGYGVVSCSEWVTATATYGLVRDSGQRLGMATVFSSQAAASGQLVVVQGDGTRTGLALVNDSPFTQRYTIQLFGQTGNRIDTRSLTVGPGGHISSFVDELVSVPSGAFIGSLSISSVGGFHAIGVFFDGAVFTTVPVTVFF